MHRCQYHILWNAVKERQEYYVDIYKKLSDSEKVRVSKLYRTFETIIVYGDQFRDLLRYLESEKFLIKELNGTQLTFYNLKQDSLVYKCLLSKAAHRVMLSATVGDPDIFKDSIETLSEESKDEYVLSERDVANLLSNGGGLITEEDDEDDFEIPDYLKET